MPRPDRLALALLLSLVLPITARAQAPADGAGPCSTPEHRQFDFWIGDWDIEQRILDPDGDWLTFPARTSVRPALDGCALVEHWEGEVQFFWQGMEAPDRLLGLSVRSYDADAGEWVIRWMDTRTPKFGDGSRGIFEDGVGSFYREGTSPDGRSMTSRIRFFDIRPETVKWDLAISTDDRVTWTTIWEMYMTRCGARRDYAC